MSSVEQASRLYEAAVVAELFTERVAELVRMSSVDGWVPRDPILVLEAMIAHLLNYVGGEIVIRENSAGPGLVVQHHFRPGDGDQVSRLAVTGVGHYAFNGALVALFQLRDEFGFNGFVDDCPF